MSPVRYEDDRRRRPITSWDNWVDRAIEEAKERGEFDNLPDQGKPLRVESNPFAPELDLAHSILKNADMAPPWIELNRAIEAEIAALATVRERTGQRVAAALTQLTQPAQHPEPAVDVTAPPVESAWASRWRPAWLFGRPASPPPGTSPQRPTLASLAAERERARVRYLERAAALDKKIREYHDTLPPTLWHLQRTRLTPERAARDFDAAVPPVEANTGTEGAKVRTE